MQRVQRDTFNPSDFDNSSVNDDSYDDFMPFDGETSDVTTKGDNKAFKIDTKKFAELCEKFRKNPDKRIDELTGQDKDDFNLIVSYVQLLFDTDYYKYLYAKVEDKFKDLKYVKPGTVGGYLAGCLINNNFHGKAGCSLTCAGAAPLPKDDENYLPCDRAVVWAEYKSDNKNIYAFHLNVLKPADNKEDLDPLYLYVTSENKSFNNVHEFPGLSKSEKEQLVNMGVNKVHIFSYTSEHKYIDLYGRPVNLKDVKNRTNNSSGNGGLGLAITLIVIFIILLIVFFGWPLWNNNSC